MHIRELPFGVKMIVGAMLLLCLLVLSKYILFKKSPRYYKQYFHNEYARYKIAEGKKKANLVPFKTIKLMQSSRLRADYKLSNIWGNIAGFIPLGILFPFLFKGLRRSWKVIPFIFLFSLGFEVIQLVTGIGVFDVDDLILNVTGGLVGYTFFRMFLLRYVGRTVLQKEKEI